MKKYFQLQLKILNRKLTEFGIEPFLVYMLFPVGFIWVSKYIFSRTEFAVYIYVFTAFSLLLKLSDTKRNDFLRLCFSNKSYFKLRVIENILLTSPFVVFLVYISEIKFSIILSTITVLMSFTKLNVTRSYTLPTPFGKRPFEFPMGFRKTFLVFPLAYLLTCISVSVHNFNLGMFSMLLTSVTVMSYFSKVENSYYVWSFSYTPKEFLFRKIRTAIIYTTLLSLPTCILLCFFFTTEIVIIGSFLLLCYVYIIQFIYVKYSAYPKEINFPQGILFMMSVVFPPFIFFTLPYFYSQSLKQLNTILND